ncbi:hypothetical protein BKA62DRAFT_676870 [Auriculariales sp. MPI-PUGE-AT-0066]|nr:hypothetical protein BKA62DRAFT_676870 [Auriculariales sp. MPI-PUGE-AT-0066]
MFAPRAIVFALLALASAVVAAPAEIESRATLAPPDRAASVTRTTILVATPVLVAASVSREQLLNHVIESISHVSVKLNSLGPDFLPMLRVRIRNSQRTVPIRGRIFSVRVSERVHVCTVSSFLSVWDKLNYSDYSIIL